MLTADGTQVAPQQRQVAVCHGTGQQLPRHTIANFGAGQGDLFVGFNTENIIGRAVAFFLTALKDQDGKPPFTGATIITPPRLVWDISHEEIVELISKGFEDLYSSAPPATIVNMFGEMVNIIQCECLAVDLVVNAVSKAGANQLICIIDAAKYRDSTIQLDFKPGLTAIMIHGDVLLHK